MHFPSLTFFMHILLLLYDLFTDSFIASNEKCCEGERGLLYDTISGCGWEKNRGKLQNSRNTARKLNHVSHE